MKTITLMIFIHGLQYFYLYKEKNPSPRRISFSCSLSIDICGFRERLLRLGKNQSPLDSD